MQKDITGVMIYYFFICHRKLWYFYHQINMENENENVQIGKLLDETSYSREDKHINIDNVINIDYLRNEHVLHEVKKSRSIEDAGIWQLKYYLYYLKKRGVEGLTGKIDYPLLRRNVAVELSGDDERILDESIGKIYEIVQEKCAPFSEKQSICKKCAYYDLCFI